MLHFRNQSFVTREEKYEREDEWRERGDTSVGRNSTRQPILLLTGGGLKRIDCQFVELIFFEERDRVFQFTGKEFFSLRNDQYLSYYPD